MKKFMQTIQNMLADAALLEMGATTTTAPGRCCRESSETLEENFIEVAFAEAADYDQIHDAILWEHRRLGVCHT